MKVAFRTEASAAIGTGHVVRCRVLADALRERGAEVVEDAATAVDWLVVDHYDLDAAWERAARRSAKRILAIDDLDRAHDCDVLLDQNYFRDPWARYEGRVPQRARRLLGPRYALLRPEFAQAQKRPRDGTVRRVLISFGGVDAGNDTARAILAVRPLSLAADIVLGEANPHAAEIERLCGNDPAFTIHRPAGNMAELMQRADLALGAGGTTAWERCCLGLPTIQLAVAPNQEAPTQALAADGFVFHEKEISSAVVAAVISQREKLAGQSKAKMAMVEGEGRRRVAAALLAGPDSRFALRDARAGDVHLYFAWANDPEVRQQSFRAEAISWTEHEPWFAQRLAEAVLLVAEDEAGMPLGQVRFERADGRWTIHYSIAPEFRGVGLGAKMLAAAIAELRRRYPSARLRAAVKPDNTASLRVFAGLGFKEISASIFELDS
ncbi:MAG: UDP-2,4-diacetamido-2,4,6-trideoxy-beta-L-altropyranose hydrolase [Betaproteobacteria bacterium]